MSLLKQHIFGAKFHKVLILHHKTRLESNRLISMSIADGNLNKWVIVQLQVGTTGTQCQ